MDVSTIDDVIYWINRQPGWDTVSSAEVVRESRESRLPGEAREAIAGLSEGSWTRAELVAEVRELMLARIPR